MADFDIYNRDQQPQPAAAPPLAEGTSFDIYNKPPPAARGPLARMITGEPEPVGYAEDIAKGVAGGLGRGVAGTISLGGTIGNFTRWGLEKAGVPESGIDYAKRVLNRAAPMTRVFSGPDAGRVQGVMEGVTGKFYEPQTIPGQYASTIAEFAPGAVVGGPVSSIPRAIAARTLNTVVPAVTSETAGQFTKDTPYEPYARFAGGLVGGIAGAKAITPIGPAEGAYARAVAALEKEGIPLTAGQRTGSKKLQWTESAAVDMPGVGGQAARLQAAPREALDRAVTQRIYDPAELAARGVPEGVHLPDPRVAVAGPQSLSDAYTRLTQSDFVWNPRVTQRLRAAEDEYNRLVQPHKRATNIENTRKDIVDRLVVGQGKMAGDEYQSIRSQIGDDIRTATNSKEKAALIEYKRALDEGYLAGLSPKDAAALMQNNRRYALMKQIQPAVDTATETLSPAKLAQTVRARRGAQYSARQGDLDELANAAATVMKPLPQSGTAPRLAAQSGGGGVIGTGLGAVVGGPVGAAIGAGVGAVGPLVAPYLATSRLGQAYLGNRALPQSMRDVLAQTLAQQAISQEAGIERNQANRDAYKKLQRVYVNRRD
jgi:hypothetical protein